MRLTDIERSELLALADSESLRKDMAHVAATRHNPFLVDGEVSPERVMEFLTQYNDFLNHQMRPPRPFLEKNMKL
uniref:Uncharacterized protein n=1 Tax=Geobacter sp. (strain M21) TaxID=443144 RepID=C6E1Q3_GEOSM